MNIRRLLIIDRCLRDTSRKWSLQDLIDACAETNSNSRRSVQADLELMRSAERGYSAPIVVVDKKYYVYKDESYSLLKQLITSQDADNMNAALDEIEAYTAFRQLHDIRHTLTDLRNQIGDALNSENANRPRKKSDVPIIRLWVSEAFAERVQAYPFDKTQRIESMEIDGSVNIVFSMPITKELEYFLLLNDDNIRVNEPQSLANKIKKLKG